MISIRFLVCLPVHLYRWTIGAIVPKSCRYEPSCSNYAIEAIQLHGPARGTWLALKRMARCHPWGGCGYDPVPDPKSAESSAKVA